MKSRYLQQGMYAAVFTVAAAQVNAASPVDFSSLVEQVSPAVVSVNVVKKMTQEELLQQQVPEILRRFFGNQVIIPQQQGPCNDINYDPLILPDGMAPSSDPILNARSSAYAKSYNLRTHEQAQQKGETL